MSGAKVADHTETRSVVSNLHRKTKLESIGSIERCWAGEVTGVVVIPRSGAEELIAGTVADKARQGIGNGQVHRGKSRHGICQLLFVGHLQCVVSGAAFRYLEGSHAYVAVDAAKSRAAQVGGAAPKDVTRIESVAGEVVDGDRVTGGGA